LLLMKDVKIIMVGDETKESLDIIHILESLDCEVQYLAFTGEEALEKALESPPDLILTDIILEGEINGIELASNAKDHNIPVIFLTTPVPEDVIQKAMETEPYGYLVKPFENTELKFAIEMAAYKKKVENELRWSDKRLKIGMDIGKMVYWEYDIGKDLFTFDEQFYALYGTSADKEGGNQMSSAEYAGRFVPVEEQELVGIEVSKALETDDPDFSSTIGHWIIRGDGERRFIIVRIRVRFDENGKKIGTRGVNQDITELKIAEDALAESDQRLKDIIDFLPDATFTIDTEGRVISWNQAIEQMTGIWAEEILGKGNYEYSLPFYGKRKPMLIDLVNASETEIRTYYTKFKRNGQVITAENEVTVRGNPIIIWGKAVPLYDNKGNSVGAIETIRDVTDFREAQKKLRKSLDEKEMHLKEIHHRVKNNLMVISSLLELESRYIKDKSLLGVFKESQNRAKSMAYIHERLYRSTDLKRIDFGDYIQSLGEDIYETYVIDPDRIKLNLKVEDVMVDVNTSVPLGLIVNELLTNSMKYAFPGDRSGEIELEFSCSGDEYLLRVADNGVGFPEDVDYKNTSSLGLQLVTSLTEQINGKISLRNKNGTEFKITFKEQY